MLRLSKRSNLRQGRCRSSSARWCSVLLVGACLFLGLFTTSCGLLSRTKSLFGGKLPIQVSVAKHVNDDSPVAVELIVVSSKKILDELLKKSAREWFEERDQFKRDFPEGKGYQSWQWEWVPGQEVPPIEGLQIKSGVKAGIIFADYFSPGQHRSRFDPRKPLRLVLEEKEFVVGESL